MELFALRNVISGGEVRKVYFYIFEMQNGSNNLATYIFFQTKQGEEFICMFTKHTILIM